MSIAMPVSNTLSLPARAPAHAETASSGQGGSAGSVNSTEILRGQKAVEINHNGSTYRLQATRLGKLILTK
jgi:hemin uptake protein HemP